VPVPEPEPECQDQDAKTPKRQDSNPQRPGSPQPAARSPPPAARPAAGRDGRGWRLWPASCVVRRASCVSDPGIMDRWATELRGGVSCYGGC
jgi:hypothetical protein